MRSEITTSRLAIVLQSAATALLFAVAPMSMAGTIAGSDHDFSGINPDGQICVNCHTPHNADTSVATAPLWNHDVTSATFTLYSSPTMNAIPGQPSGSSKLCLSCHDGTVAVDSFGGRTGSVFIQPTDSHYIGTDLSNDHPISITYDSALATADPGLNDPAVTTVTIGQGGDKTNTGTVSELMLPADQVQCSSCHDVHNNFVPPGAKDLLRVTVANSQLCFTCHNK
ncbi:MAG: cytochrome C [Gammaproteobacteria bacterium]|nr:MAG: cytochrome C [Gammaproteobacteria bacterium]